MRASASRSIREPFAVVGFVSCKVFYWYWSGKSTPITLVCFHLRYCTGQGNQAMGVGHVSKFFAQGYEPLS